MENNTPNNNKDITVMSGGSETRSHKKRNALIILTGIIILALGAAIYFFAYQQTPTATTNENQGTVIDVSSQIDEANKYPDGSYFWANLMLNAATYASANGACGQANDILSQVENTQLEEEVDIDSVRQQVQEDCRA
jgi:hypothetical protein